MSRPTLMILRSSLLAASLAIAPGFAQSSDDGWILHNTIDVIMDEGVVTRLDTINTVRDPGSEYTISTQEEFNQAVAIELDAASRKTLRSQAGEQLGLRSDDIDRYVEQEIWQSKEGKSLSEFGDSLALQGLDPASNREAIRSDLHARVWEGSVLGWSAAGLGRKSVDRYIRPGLLHILYDENRAQLANPPARFRFLALVVNARAAGSLENARMVCRQQLEEIIAGKEFELAVEEVGSELRSTKGDTGWFPLWELDPAYHAFAQNSLLDSLSDPLPVRGRNGEITAYQVLKLIGREDAGDAPPFTDARVQRALQDRFWRQLDGYLLSKAERDLLRRAYVWRNVGP